MFGQRTTQFTCPATGVHVTVAHHDTEGYAVKLVAQGYAANGSDTYEFITMMRKLAPPKSVKVHTMAKDCSTILSTETVHFDN